MPTYFKHSSTKNCQIDIISRKYLCTLEILNTAHLTPFSTTQYLFSILYLPTQIQMDIVYRKPGFQDFWCTKMNNHLITNTYLNRLKILYTQHEFIALNTYLSSFSKVYLSNEIDITVMVSFRKACIFKKVVLLLLVTGPLINIKMCTLYSNLWCLQLSMVQNLNFLLLKHFHYHPRIKEVCFFSCTRLIEVWYGQKNHKLKT